MISPVFAKTLSGPPINKKEIFRYAGVSSPDKDLSDCLEECLKDISEKLTYKVCFRILDLEENSDGTLSLPPFSFVSKDLSKNLKGCRRVIVFAATVGVEMDRLIARYSSLSPSKAVWMQAIGAERVEAVCNLFCRNLEDDMNVTLRPRFSPGYGDLPLSVQKDIVRILDTAKNIGVTNNDHFLLSPHKSVTAFVGIVDETAVN